MFKCNLPTRENSATVTVHKLHFGKLTKIVSYLTTFTDQGEIQRSSFETMLKAPSLMKGEHSNCPPVIYELYSFK